MIPTCVPEQFLLKFAVKIIDGRIRIENRYCIEKGFPLGGISVEVRLISRLIR